jgi:hypothetical protein
MEHKMSEQKNLKGMKPKEDEMQDAKLTFCFREGVKYGSNYRTIKPYIEFVRHNDIAPQLQPIQSYLGGRLLQAQVARSWARPSTSSSNSQESIETSAAGVSIKNKEKRYEDEQDIESSDVRADS